MLQQDSMATSRSDAPATGGASRALRAWLLAVAALIFVMVIVGGATRLTESGLSITEWRPVTGVIPPLSQADWAEEFARYRQIPQYSALNADMTLDGFKTIFYWEWSHRLLARLIGAAFILTALWFWRSGRFKGALGRQIAVATGLLALEPIVGWWMVSSGLAERVEVAQDRLALHLLIAAAAFGALIYAAAGLGERPRDRAGAGFRTAAGALAALVFCQLGLGALVAGLRAGLVYNTWPLMDGGLIPAGAFGLAPWPRSIVDDAATAQFDHRLIAYAVVLFALALAFAAQRRAPRSALARRAGALAALAVLQTALGIVTLLTAARIEFALVHQAVALALFGAAVANWGATGMERGEETAR
jgi:cytochrome c oxidase assembly protein subunit 15